MPSSDNLYVQNLPFSCKEDDVRAVFSQYGMVQSCGVMNNSEYGKAVAFIKFGNSAGAKKAHDALQGKKPDLLRSQMSDGLLIKFTDTQQEKLRKAQERMLGGEQPIQRIKRLQRENTNFRTAWTSYCKQHNKPLDPTRQDPIFMAQAMAHSEAGIRKPTQHYSLMTDDTTDVNSAHNLKKQKILSQMQSRWKPPPGALAMQQAMKAAEDAKRQREEGRKVGKAGKRKKCPMCGDKLPLFANFCGRGHKQPDAADGEPVAVYEEDDVPEPPRRALLPPQPGAPMPGMGQPKAIAPPGSGLAITAAPGQGSTMPVPPVGQSAAPPSKRQRVEESDDSSVDSDDIKRANRPTVGSKVKLAANVPAEVRDKGCLRAGEEGVIVRDMWKERGVPEYAVRTQRGSFIYEEGHLVVLGGVTKPPQPPSSGPGGQSDDEAEA
eukprot:Hpha_TRINITY_DN29630_c0_g1::TRINITY_DN29630_c0_g1_i1::g.165053::m.165053